MASKFYKYEASGNDFILIEDFDRTFPLSLTHSLCHRNFGIGADGILLLQPSKIADIKMRILNQDGSEATMCGNGLRAVVAHLKKDCTIETLAGISHGKIDGDQYKVTLPTLEIVEREFFIDDLLSGYLVNTGTPHLVLFTEKLEDPNLISKAKTLTQNGYNVDLAKVTQDGAHVRTFEKGVMDETLTCGTGGGAVALLLKERVNLSSFHIQFRMHSLNYQYDNNYLWLKGPVNPTFYGFF